MNRQLVSAAVCMLLFCGCSVTDELTVFEDRVLSEAQMQPFLGTYTLTASTSNMRKGELTVRKTGARYFGVFESADKDGKRYKSEGHFLLSHIPTTAGFRIGETDVRFTTNRDTILLSIPKLTVSEPPSDDMVLDNVVLIVKREGTMLYVWQVLTTASVAKGRLEAEGGVMKADEVKSFLAEYADAYVLANEPEFVFAKR